MSVWLNLGLILLTIALLLGAMVAAKWQGQRHGFSAELQRKCVHVATGLYALTLPFTFDAQWPVLLMCAVSVVVLMALRLPAFARSGMASAVHGVQRKSHGEIYLAIAVGVIFLLSAGKPVLFVLPVLVLTLSDAAAALAGTHYGRRHFTVEAGTKTLEGVTIFFLVTWLLALIALLAMTEIGRGEVVLLSLLIAAFGALVEADSWRGLDNLFVPLGVHFLLSSHAETPPLALLLLVLAFLATLLAMIRFGRLLGLSAHASRAYVVLVFLICAITAPHNAILPVLTVFAHIAARALAPCRSPFPDLDLLAVMAGVAIFWLFAGTYTGSNALNVYNLTYAGMIMLFAALAVQPAGMGLRLAVLVAVAAALWPLMLAIAGRNLASMAWHGPLWPWLAGTLLMALATGLGAPGWFRRYRSVRVLAVAVPLPLLLFVTKGMMA